MPTIHRQAPTLREREEGQSWLAPQSFTGAPRRKAAPVERHNLLRPGEESERPKSATPPGPKEDAPEWAGAGTADATERHDTCSS